MCICVHIPVWVCVCACMHMCVRVSVHICTYMYPILHILIQFLKAEAIPLYTFNLTKSPAHLTQIF